MARLAIALFVVAVCGSSGSHGVTDDTPHGASSFQHIAEKGSNYNDAVSNALDASGKEGSIMSAPAGANGQGVWGRRLRQVDTRASAMSSPRHTAGAFRGMTQLYAEGLHGRVLQDTQGTCNPTGAGSLPLLFAYCCPQEPAFGSVDPDILDLWQNTFLNVTWTTPDGVTDSSQFLLLEPQAQTNDANYNSGPSVDIPECSTMSIYALSDSDPDKTWRTLMLWDTTDLTAPVWTGSAKPDASGKQLVVPVCAASWYLGCGDSTNGFCAYPEAYCSASSTSATGFWKSAPPLPEIPREVASTSPPPSPAQAPPTGTPASPIAPTVPPPITSPDVPTIPPAPSKGSSSTGAIIGGVVGGLVLLLLAIVLLLFCIRRKREAARAAEKADFAGGVLSRSSHTSPSAGADITQGSLQAPLAPPGGGKAVMTMSAGQIWIPSAAASSDGKVLSKTVGGASSGWSWEGGVTDTSTDSSSVTQGGKKLPAFPRGRVLVTREMNNMLMTFNAASGNTFNTLSSGWDTEWMPDELCEQIQEMANRKILLAGKYLLTGEMAGGGQGCVVFATMSPKFSGVGRTLKVAIKFHFNSEAFQNEARLVGTKGLESYLPRVIELSSIDAHALRAPNGRILPPYIILPRGEPLDLFICSHRPDSLHCVMILIHLAEKLAAMHAAGLVHRDVKPANVIWLPVEHEWNLIDFGCAAQAGKESQIMFTPSYASPETIQAVTNNIQILVVDPKVDVWALGVVAYQLLTGDEVLATMSVEQLWAALQGQGLMPWESNDDIETIKTSRPFALMIKRMLDRDVNQRPTMQEVLQGWREATGLTSG